MKTLENEIIKFHEKQAEIAKRQIELSEIGKVIIKKYCPYKVGDKVIFTEWWRENNKDYYGVIKHIGFNGIDPDAIDNRWKITIEPTTKDFSKPVGSYNSSYKFLGKNEGDKIRKANA